MINAYLTEKDPYKKACLKAQTLSEIDLSSFSSGEYQIEIQKLKSHEDFLQMYLTVKRNGARVSIDGFVRFYNPPVIVQSGVDGEIMRDGTVVEKPFYVEDPAQALKDMIINLVKHLE